MAVVSNVDLQRKILKQERELNQLKKLFGELAARFGTYHVDEHTQSFALVVKVNGTKADLVAIGNHCSGEIDILRDKEIVDPREGWPKADRWEPIVKPQEVIDLMEEIDREVEEAPNEPRLATVSRPR